MTYFLVYKKGTVIVVACVCKATADRLYRNDPRYTLKLLKNYE